MKVKKNARWALVVPTSMGVRLTSAQLGQPVQSATGLVMQATSAETNVASVSSYLGLPVKALTAFVKGSPIAAFIKSELRARGIEFEGPEVEQGGPWGYRHQINIADSGYGSRGPRVWNDRAGEVGRTLDAKNFNLDRLFEHEGVGILHLSGLIAALSPETGRFCVELARAAHKAGTLVSFDLNHRATFWEGREKELAGIFDGIAAETDILIGNEEDFQLALGIEGPAAGGEGLSTGMEGFRALIGNARKRYPRAGVFATTLREVISVNRHLWGAVLWTADCADMASGSADPDPAGCAPDHSGDGSWHTVAPREISVLDRIGGGDGFVGGMLYAILRGWEPEKWVQFGWATGALATTFFTDYAQPADESQVWSVWKGNARVLR
uniref:Putative carbohydrate kinase n=1 Tax=termite gut metagenome TaxID=433724 RepID=S0DDJ2_9ZZZZ